MAKLAPALVTLRNQINQAFPKRSKTEDGWIGDARHAARKSDHNPNAQGVVCAIDVTHDPLSGCTGQCIADVLCASKDPRINYVIWNRAIFFSYTYKGVAAWRWMIYNGNNPHNKHVHISVRQDQKLYNDARKWKLSSKFELLTVPVTTAGGVVASAVTTQHGSMYSLAAGLAAMAAIATVLVLIYQWRKRRSVGDGSMTRMIELNNLDCVTQEEVQPPIVPTSV